MSDLHLRKAPGPGLTEVYRAGSGPLSLISFSLVQLQPAETFDLDTGASEYALVLLTGVADLALDGQNYTELGGRTSVFAGKATAAYLPPGTDARLTARSPLLAALAGVPSDSRGPAQVLRPADVAVKAVGNWNWRREVHDLVSTASVPQAQKLLVGETYNPPGNWSSYPPHKHEKDEFPEEVAMEELYYFRLNPPQGFGLQRVYTDDCSLDVSYALEDGDVVLLPKGYHPVVAGPGYQLYYLWIMAGAHERRMAPRDDPQHAWVKAVGAMARDMGF